jgi:CBS domain-containing protein
LVVTDDKNLMGIITERDILRVTAARGASLDRLWVGDHMSSPVITGTAEDDVQMIMGVMTSHRIRHLPIVENGQLAGIISIGDVVKAQHDRLSVENHYLKSYIHG